MYEYIAKVDLFPSSEGESINISRFNNPINRDEMSEIINKCKQEDSKAANIIQELNRII